MQTELALLAIGLSVLMHVSWNLLARHVPRECNFLWWGLLAHSLLLGPWAVWSLIEQADWQATLWLALLFSALSNALYFVALRQAYHHAPVALVYPVARSSPLLIAAWGLLLFDQQLAPLGWLGILVNIGGLGLMAWSSRQGDARHALPWALAAALCTSVYSLSDKVAVTYLPSLTSQLGFVSIGYLLSLLVLSALNRREHGRWQPRCRPAAVYWLSGGLFVGTAYALVIYAMQVLPAAYAVAYTNAGIVIATLLSITLFRERQAWRSRLAGSLIIGCGLLLIGFSR